MTIKDEIGQIKWHDPESYYTIRAKDILSKVILEGECWICHYAPSKVGYPKISKDVYAHVFICETIHGPIIDGKYVIHSCDNHRCIRPKHIRPAWPYENAHDMYAKGRQGNVGGNKPRTFSEEDRLKMQELSVGGWSQRKIAAHFNTTQSTIWNYVNNRHYGETQ